MSKIWYQLTDKYGKNKHLGAYALINASISKSKVGLKIKQNLGKLITA